MDERKICVRTIISGYRKLVVKKRQEKTTHKLEGKTDERAIEMLKRERVRERNECLRQFGK